MDDRNKGKKNNPSDNKQNAEENNSNSNTRASTHSEQAQDLEELHGLQRDMTFPQTTPTNEERRNAIQGELTNTIYITNTHLNSIEQTVNILPNDLTNANSTLNTYDKGSLHLKNSSTAERIKEFLSNKTNSNNATPNNLALNRAIKKNDDATTADIIGTDAALTRADENIENPLPHNPQENSTPHMMEQSEKPNSDRRSSNPEQLTDAAQSPTTSSEHLTTLPRSQEKLSTTGEQQEPAHSNQLTLSDRGNLGSTDSRNMGIVREQITQPNHATTSQEKSHASDLTPPNQDQGVGK